jgi:hypothetical protein
MWIKNKRLQIHFRGSGQSNNVWFEKDMSALLRLAPKNLQHVI